MSVNIQDVDVIVIGAGSAGLMAAISLAPLTVLLISDNLPEQEQTASHWSKGGIAAPISEEDSPEKHIEDTMTASCGFADRNVVSHYVNMAPELIDYLIKIGVNFDYSNNGKIYLGREGSHSLHRVLTANRDSFGLELMRVLTKNLYNSNHITHLSGAKVVSLLKENGTVNGVKIKYAGGEKDIKSSAVILATGGIGALYARTTNPPCSKGYGIAMAFEVGAKCKNLEFVQFHPTAINCELEPLPMISEALRGAGAKITNSSGQRFMSDIHEMAELAPRDIVCRAIEDQIIAGEKIYLDIKGLTQKYPSALKACKRAGINPEKEKIPITTAAHYHMGGVYIDYKTGETSVKGLWACGEVACTGMHGANRLASNSLLEALITGRLCAKNIISSLGKSRIKEVEKNIKLSPYIFAPPPEEMEIKKIMTDNVGVYRNNNMLQQSIDKLIQMGKGAKNRDIYLCSLTARLIASSALERKNSIGAHFRTDYP